MTTTDDPAVHLRAGGTSLVIQVSDRRLPRILHWGEDLGDLTQADMAAMVRTAQPAVGDSAVTYPQPIPVLPQLAEGWLGRPGLVGDTDGTRWAPLFVDARHSVENGERLGTVAHDEKYALSLRLEIEVLAGSGLVRQRATLTNEGVAPYRLHHLELTLPVPSSADELLDTAGRWSLERRPQRREFTVGESMRTSRGGKPGLEHPLLVAAGERGFGFRSGRVWATHLAWSGNQTIGAERTPAGTRHLVAGEDLLPGEVVLGQGETYTSPWQYGSWGEGLDELASRFHRHLRARPRRMPRPVLVNTWESVYFGHDLGVLQRFAEVAAGVGAERFVLDDGWFVGRRDDTTSLGDWDVDPQVWPDGLGPLVETVHGLGMDFGLWFEPEMVSLDSELAREHPEWLFDAGHGVGLPSRHQHVLDLGHPEAYEHVLGKISDLVERYSIAYIKWDHNRYLLDAGHAPTGVPGVRRQVQQVYRMMAALKARYPGLEIESCASGGGRIDLGILELTDRVWSSDCIDPHERLEIQWWTGLLVPPEMQGTHIGAEQSHTTHRSHPLAYRAEKALWGSLGVEMNLLEASAEERARIAQWIAFHTSLRDLLHTGTVVHADLADPGLRLEGVVAPDRSRALYAFSVVERPTTWPPGRIALPGLDDERAYRVALAGPDAAAVLAGHHPPWLDDEATVLPGAVLRRIGIEAPSIDVDRSVLFEVTALVP